MTRHEFMGALNQELSGFPPAEVKKLMEYYEELFADGLEAGKTEEEICGELETPRDIAERVQIELAFVRARQKPSPKSLNAVLLIILGVFALPLGLQLAAVLLAAFVVVISLVGAAAAVALALGVSGAVALGMGIYMLFIGFPLAGIATIGAALILIGLGIMGTIGFSYLIRAVFRGIIRLFHSIYNGVKARKGRKIA